MGGTVGNVQHGLVDGGSSGGSRGTRHHYRGSGELRRRRTATEADLAAFSASMSHGGGTPVFDP